jgi:isochorismate synthase
MQIKESLKISIYEALKICLDKRLTFAAYRHPGREEVTLVIQKDNNICELSDLSELTEKKGFLIAPFFSNQGDSTFLIRPDMLIRNSVSMSQIDEIKSVTASYVNGIEYIAPAQTSKEDFIQQVEKTIEAIKTREYEKVVISRVKIVEGDYKSRLADIFKLLSEQYINAFVYLFRVKDQCWIGASPEPLICTRENELITVSLAGTRPYNESNLEIARWNRKELIEQEYVTRYIEKILDDYNIKGYQMKGPYAKRAGQLLHLRTDFIFPVNLLQQNLYSFIGALHPTSAVCGMPMVKARQFIASVENHNREYYTGFIGPVGIDDKLQLFVTLRCMKVFEHQLALFVGGGITSDSVPEEEWEETEIKADTLLSVVHQVY